MLALRYLFLFSQAIEDYGLDAKVILKTLVDKLENQEAFLNGKHCLKPLIFDLKHKIEMGIDECERKSND